MPPKKESNVVHLSVRKGGGRNKQPIEKRKALSKDPHKNRQGEPDVPMGATLNLEQIPTEPPIPLSPYERECWDMITATQRGEINSRWIYRSDCSYIIATCALYGMWRKSRDELEEYHLTYKTYLLEDGKAPHPLVAATANLLTKYHASLSNLGLSPTKRQVSLGVGESKEEHGLLA